jgi:5'-nucleotidase
MHTKLKQILEEGLENLQVVLDFDRTITGPKSTGESAPPMIAFLRNSDMLGEKYREAAQTNFEYYRPLELSGELSHEEKSRSMHEWWSKHLQLLVDFGLTRDKIAQIANSPDLICRNGVVDFMKFCEANYIPVIVFSAGILGSESIKLFLERYGAYSTNVKIITNELVFNEDGKVTGFREPIIHSENKSEEVFEVEGVVQRKNTILAGDGLGDVKMVLDKPGSLVYRYAVLDNITSEIKNKYLVSFDEVVADFGVILSELKRVDETSREVRGLE